MAQIIMTHSALLTVDGQAYTARSCGRQRSDGLWEGWIEFVPSGGGRVIRSARETTQPNLHDLQYWATGLTGVYLEGSLERTLTPPTTTAAAPARTATYDGPAQTRTTAADAVPTAPILDPFAVYAEGETLLRRRLTALAPRHLRAIARAYELADDAQLEQLDEPGLIALIVSAVQQRAA